MQAPKQDIINEAKYLKSLVDKILEASFAHDDKEHTGQQSRGTIYNLAPEVSKTASKLRRMVRHGYR